jgi:hypothetical protein
MIALQLPDDFPNLPVVVDVGDAAGHLLLTVVHQKTPQSDDVEYAAVYMTESNWANPVLIGRDDLSAKTSAGFARLRPGKTPDKQTVELIVTEAGTPGGPGNSNVVHVYTFVDAVPGRVPLQAADQPARDQAVAATNIAKAAIDAVRALATDLVAAAGKHD